MPLMRRRKLSGAKSILSQASLSNLAAQKIEVEYPNKPTKQRPQCLLLLLTAVLLLCFHHLTQRNERSLDMINADNLDNTPREIPAVYADKISPCTLTVVIAEPSLPLLPPNDMAYSSSLESTAEFAAPGSCLVIQTSACRLQDYVRRHNVHPATVVMTNKGQIRKLSPASTERAHTTEKDYSAWTTRQLVSESIRHRSGPHLSRWIHTGRVRLTFLNHTQYNFPACDSYDANALWMSSRYYVEEFAEEDSDLVLFIQRDSFLCRGLWNLEEWRRYAFVGGPWTKEWGRLGIWTVRQLWNRRKGFIVDDEDARRENGVLRKDKSNSGRYNIDDWRDYWHSDNGMACSMERGLKNCTLLDHPRLFPTDYPSRETRLHKRIDGMVGNGGLSLRSRTWMLRAIRICPHPKFAQLPANILNRAMCKAHDDMRLQEDVYFSAILGAIGAPLPTPLEAQLFCQDEPWSDALIPNMHAWNETVTRLFGKEYVDNNYSLGREQSMKSFMSLAYHKCWEPKNCPLKTICKYSTVEEESFASSFMWTLWSILVSVWLWVEDMFWFR